MVQMVGHPATWNDRMGRASEPGVSIVIADLRPMVQRAMRRQDDRCVRRGAARLTAVGLPWNVAESFPPSHGLRGAGFTAHRGSISLIDVRGSLKHGLVGRTPPAGT